jgi:hypothetical protein
MFAGCQGGILFCGIDKVNVARTRGQSSDRRELPPYDLSNLRCCVQVQKGGRRNLLQLPPAQGRAR